MLGKCELINDLVANNVNLQFWSKSLLERRPITLHNYLKKNSGNKKRSDLIAFIQRIFFHLKGTWQQSSPTLCGFHNRNQKEVYYCLILSQQTPLLSSPPWSFNLLFCYSCHLLSKLPESDINQKRQSGAWSVWFNG